MHSSDCDCILLAAGLSSRASGNKLLATISGRPLIQRSLSHALSACARVILVLGHDADAILPAARAALTPEASPRFLSTKNERYRLGMFSSVQAGVRHVRTEWFFVVPADLPDLTPDVYERVVDTVPDIHARARANPAATGTRFEHRGRSSTVSAGPVAIVPEWNGQRGHPVLIHRSLASTILERAPDEGPMRSLLARYDIARVSFGEPAVTVDLDTDEAIERYKSSSSDQRSPSP